MASSPRRLLSLLFTFLTIPFAAAQDETPHNELQDSPSPYDGDGNAPDVFRAYDDSGSYPDFEGTSAPDLVDYYNDTLDASPEAPDPIGLVRRAGKDFYLRVMPLGASITQGSASSDGNGYRQLIRSQLRFAGWKVNMVGSKQDGRMRDNDNEGHPGYIIQDVHGQFSNHKNLQPNLILLNAGTNDCAFNVNIPQAGQRYKTMLDDIFASIPGVTVVATTVLKSRDHNACTIDVSNQLRDLFRNYGNPRFAWSDWNNILEVSELSSDGTHPPDAGYRKLAAGLWGAIQTVQDRIQPPNNVPGLDDSKVVGSGKSCAKKAGNARGPIQSQAGSGHDDAKYVHKSKEMGKLDDMTIIKGPDQKVNDGIPQRMFFAQLINSFNQDRSAALDDWIRVEHRMDDTNIYWVRENLGGGKFGKSKSFDVDQNCNLGPTYAFADFNNDGLADFYCLGAGGKVTVSINKGGNPPTFKSIGQVVPAFGGISHTDVRIGDIDGDGRADFCVLNAAGDLMCSRNGAPSGNNDGYFWEGFQTQAGTRQKVFGGQGKDKSGIRLGDLNGDFRADWMWVNKDGGGVTTFINQRGWGYGIVPEWVSSGLTHGGLGSDKIKSSDNVKFGRIYGTGRLDYINIREEKDRYDVYVYQNVGTGGTKRKADGNFYCDMTGKGADDYVWIYNDGHAAEVFVNVHAPPIWGQGTKIALTVPGPRIGIHLADWDGDGRCDVLVQNRGNGALTLYKNNWDKAANKLTFTNAGVVTPGTCNQGWGVGIFDRGMRLADIDGDGRADVLCIEPNSRITAWLNTKSGMQDVGQIKFSQGWDRANIRFADVEASGRADLIHLNKYTGAAQVFKNLGHSPGGKGSSFSWNDRGNLYSPVDRGDNMYFANQGGLGRADLIHVLPVTNRAWTYFNECGGSSGGDDGAILDPGLPTIPAGDQTTIGPDPTDPDDPDGSNDEDGDDTPSCPAGDNPGSLEGLADKADSLEPGCVNLYAMDILYQQILDSLSLFRINSQDYDDSFGWYEQWTKDRIQARIDDYMTLGDGKGLKFFDCYYAVGGNVEKKSTCTGMPHIWDEDRGWTIRFDLIDEKGFYDALAADTGVDQTWVGFADKDLGYTCALPGDIKPGGGNPPCKKLFHSYKNYPTKVSDDKIHIVNPKLLIEASMNNITALRTSLLSSYLDVGLSFYDDGPDDTSATDAVVAYSMPILQLTTSVNSMKDIKEIGEQAKEEAKKKLIFTILTVVFMVIPFIGEALGPLVGSVTAIARIALLIGEAGNGALTIADIIEDPLSAPFAILGLIAGVGGGGRLGKAEAIGEASKARKALKGSDLEKFPQEFKDKDALVQKVVKSLCRK